MEIPSLAAIAADVSETLGINLSYWSPDDLKRNPGGDHIFGVIDLHPISVGEVRNNVIGRPEADRDRSGRFSKDMCVDNILQNVAVANRDSLICGQRTSMNCGHSHHIVWLNGTVLKIGDCLTVDLADPKSIQQILDFYTCKT